MQKLTQYVQEMTDRVPRTAPEADADVFFFGVRVSPHASAERLTALLREHAGVFGPVNVFDGNEHSYLELGGWVGDQGTALALMGLGAQLGIWKLLTPRTVLGADVAVDIEELLAGQGLISVQAPVLN